MAKDKPAKGEYVCEECGKTFRMAAHLGRHKSTIHGERKAPAKRTKKRKKRTTRAGARGRVGRPPNIVTRLGLRDMSLDELREVIDAAKAEAQRRLADLVEAFK